MLCIFGMSYSYIVDKMCSLDEWHELCVCWLTKHASVTNLLMWCMSSVAQVLNCTTKQHTTKKVYTYHISSLYMKKMRAYVHLHTCGNFKINLYHMLFELIPPFPFIVIFQTHSYVPTNMFNIYFTINHSTLVNTT